MHGDNTTKPPLETFIQGEAKKLPKTNTLLQDRVKFRETGIFR